METKEDTFGHRVPLADSDAVNSEKSADSTVSLEQENTDESSFWTRLQKTVRQGIERAQNQTSEDISLIDKPENFNLYTLLLLDTKDAGILTGNKGLGNEHTFDFGRARLVSCMGNLNNQPVLITGLSVVMNNGWILKKPHIPVTQSDLWQKEVVFYPLRFEKGRIKTDFYTEITAFPILYELKDTQQPFYVEKEIELTACQGDTCITQTRPYQLAVQAGKGYQTDVCPLLIHEMSVSPQQLPDNILLDVRRNQEGLIQLNLQFPEEVSLADIHNEKQHFSVYKKFIQGKTARFILKPDSPSASDEEIELNLITSLGLFKIIQKPMALPFIVDTPVLKMRDILWYGFYFFFFSPFYLLFWSVRHKSKEELVHLFYFVCETLFCCAGLYIGLIYNQVRLSSFFNQPLILIGQTILLLLLLYKPYVCTKKRVLFLLFLMPYPFLYQVAPLFMNATIKFMCGAVVWWGLCALLPFFLTYQHPILFQYMSQAEQPIRKIIRLPLVLMLAWMSVSVLLCFSQTDNSFSADKIQEALNRQESVLVNVYQKPCVMCALNDWTTRHFNPSADLIEQKKLHLMYLNQQTPEGQAFLDKYHMQPEASFYILFTPQESYGKRLENAYIESEKWAEYLTQAGLIQSAPLYQPITWQDDTQFNADEEQEILQEWQDIVTEAKKNLSLANSDISDSSLTEENEDMQPNTASVPISGVHETSVDTEDMQSNTVPASVSPLP